MTDTLIFSDGGVYPNPGSGGYAAVVYRMEGIQFISGFAPQATNNAMELMAAVKALDTCDIHEDILLVSDSKYVVDGITTHIDKWIANRWCNASDEPLKNDRLWRQLLTHRQELRVRFRWVPGHKGVPFNELADMLSKSSRTLGSQYYRDTDWAAHGHLFSPAAFQEVADDD